MMDTGKDRKDYTDMEEVPGLKAEGERESSGKIDKLVNSMRSLLEHMPALTFSKDVRTGQYLACNQAFAEYAHKSSPSGVAGLTDYEIFDRKTAAHFVEDDRRALSMSQPLVFYEDVADAAGNPRQFQTTKLKFHDEEGKLCLLGMSVDVTEMMKVKQENKLAKDAYERALRSRRVFESIVETLSDDYFNLFYVDLTTDEYVEYGSRTEAGHRTIEVHGTNFFETSRRNALSYIYKEDQEKFVRALDKQWLLNEISRHGAFVLQYRLMIGEVPTYVSLKAARVSHDRNHIIIGINNIDSQMRDRIAAEHAREERKTYQRLSALNGNLLVLYLVDPESGQYSEFSSSKGYDGLGIEKQGADFFGTTFRNSMWTVHPKDQKLFHSLITKEKILSAIRKDGVFVLNYRMVAGNLPAYVQLKAALDEEDGKPQLIIGILDIDAQVRNEQEYAYKLSAATRMANMDALTGVKNKHAYVDMERQLNEQIEECDGIEFAIVVCDINELKQINDTKGHSAGDLYIRKACRIICNVFQHSPVFRVGGDEFSVICQGNDYAHIDELMEKMDAENERNKKAGDVQIACGMALFDRRRNRSVESVFEQADRRMYEHKAILKA